MNNNTNTQIDRIEGIYVDILKALEDVKESAVLQAKNVLNLDDVVKLTGYKKSHLRKLIAQREIPFYKPTNGRMLFFDRQELEGWLKSRRMDTREDLSGEAILRRYVES